VCTRCKRVFSRKKLVEQMGTLKCPYCGGTKFSEDFGNVVLILDPEKSVVAKKINKNEKGIFALSVET